MEGSTVSGIDYGSMTDRELVVGARQAWENVGGQIPDELRTELEPAFHEVVARLEQSDTRAT